MRAFPWENTKLGDPRKWLANQIFGLLKRLRDDEFPGTGLGLAICRRIVERCNRRIWAESVVGQSSTFSFTLKAALV
jgi:signal transduction histidine kinase